MERLPIEKTVSYTRMVRSCETIGFVDFLDYFGRFSIQIAGVIYEV